MPPAASRRRQAHLAIDLGAESGRAIVGVLDGSTVALTELHRFANVPGRNAGGLFWNVPALWSEILESLRRAARFASENDVRLASAGVDTWGVDFALVGASGELVALPHCYRDERTSAVFKRVVASVGAEELYRATGIQLMPINTLFQVLAALESEPAAVGSAECLLFMPDLFHLFLTGRRLVESTIASTSQMLDPASGDWARPLLQRLGVPVRLLREISPPGTVVGPLRPVVARDTGAPADLVVVAPASHDTASAVAAVPASPGERWCYISSGTWSLAGVELAQPRITGDPSGRLFTNERGIGGTVRFLKNITGLWLLEECRRSFARQGMEHDHETLTRLAERAEPFVTLVDPSHEEFASPGDMPGKIARYARATGQPEPSDPGALVRCCLESLALAYRRTLRRLGSLLAEPPEVVHVIGGGGRNRLLNRMTADATGLEVRVGPFEATAMGNVLAQAMGLGRLDGLTGIREVARASTRPETFLPGDPGAWDAVEDRCGDGS